MLRFLEKHFSCVVQNAFLHIHPPRLQDQTTSPLLPFPALPPTPHPSRLSSTKHRCCVATAEYSHIAPALSHQGTFFLSFWDDPQLLLQQQHSSLLWIMCSLEPIYKMTMKRITKIFHYCYSFFSYSGCTWHPSHASSPSHEPLCVKSSHLPTSYRTYLTYTYICMTLETNQGFGLIFRI